MQASVYTNYEILEQVQQDLWCIVQSYAFACYDNPLTPELMIASVSSEHRETILQDKVACRHGPLPGTQPDPPNVQYMHTPHHDRSNISSFLTIRSKTEKKAYSQAEQYQ